MYFLVKCKNCERYGNVALKQGDEVCNLCKSEEEVKKDKAEKKRDDSGKFE